MAARRDYFDGCGAVHALALVAEGWALLVVRELLLGPKRFTDLRTGLPHASPNVLSQRLRELEDASGGRRGRPRPPPPPPPRRPRSTSSPSGAASSSRCCRPWAGGLRARSRRP